MSKVLRTNIDRQYKNLLGKDFLADPKDIYMWVLPMLLCIELLGHKYIRHILIEKGKVSLSKN